jgi:hypothetical protein
MSIEHQLRETLRRVQAGEALAALSREACESARVQVAEDSDRDLAWVGRVSGVIHDELGNPIQPGEVSVHVCRDWTGGPVVLAGMMSPWIDNLVARAKEAEPEGGVVMTATEARALGALLIEAAERAERVAAAPSPEEVSP